MPSMGYAPLPVRRWWWSWVLKIYCISRFDSFAPPILATPPLRPRWCARSKDGLALFEISVKEFIEVATRNGARVLHPWHHRLFQVHFLPCSCFHLLHFPYKAVGAAQSSGERGLDTSGREMIEDGFIGQPKSSAKNVNIQTMTL